MITSDIQSFAYAIIKKGIKKTEKPQQKRCARNKKFAESRLSLAGVLEQVGKAVRFWAGSEITVYDPQDMGRACHRGNHGTAWDGPHGWNSGGIGGRYEGKYTNHLAWF